MLYLADATNPTLVLYVCVCVLCVSLLDPSVGLTCSQGDLGTLPWDNVLFLIRASPVPLRYWIIHPAAAGSLPGFVMGGTPALSLRSSLLVLSVDMNQVRVKECDVLRIPRPEPELLGLESQFLTHG